MFAEYVAWRGGDALAGYGPVRAWPFSDVITGLKAEDSNLLDIELKCLYGCGFDGGINVCHLE